jgi:hypothetical protein
VSLCSSGIPSARGFLLPHHGHVVVVEVAAVERLQEVRLVVKDARRRGYDAVLGRHGAHLHDRATERDLEHADPAVGRKSIAYGPQHRRVADGRRPEPQRASPLDHVGCDNEQPTARLVEHLIDIGHTRIAMTIGIRGLSTTEERVRGYRLALERAGVPFDDELLAAGGSMRDKPMPRCETCCQ